jgi:hypothetical protein
MPDILSRALDAYAEKYNLDTAEPDSIYPYAEELAVATINAYIGDLTSELVQRFVNRYIDDVDKTMYAVQVIESGPSETAIDFRARAMLPMQIQAFERFLAGLVRNELLESDDPLIVGDLPSVPIDVVRQYGENGRAENLTRWSVDQRVEAFVADGPREWVRVFDRWAEIDLETLGPDWLLIKEAIARRDLYRRSGISADVQYLRDAPPSVRAVTKIGKRIKVDRSYLRTVGFVLECTATLLAIRWSALLRPFREEFYPTFVGRVVLLEEAGRWSDAAELTRVALEC